jgi:hypothetical protein
MLMTTWKLILLRLFNITLGRAEFFARMLRKALTQLLITDKQEKYVASSRYFDLKELRHHADKSGAESPIEQNAPGHGGPTGS